MPFYYVGGPKQADRRLAKLDVVWASFAADFKAIKAPKKWAAFHKAALADMAAYGSFLHSGSAAISPKMKSTAYHAQLAKMRTAEKPLLKSVNDRFDGADLVRCGSHF